MRAVRHERQTPVWPMAHFVFVLPIFRLVNMIIVQNQHSPNRKTIDLRARQSLAFHGVDLFDSPVVLGRPLTRRDKSTP